MKTNGDEPINSAVIPLLGGGVTVQLGLTKREYFAAMAMQGMLRFGALTEGGQISNHPTTIAKQAVSQADALIEALNK